MVLSSCKPVTSFCIQVSDVIPAFFLSGTKQTQALQDNLNQLYHSTGSLIRKLNKSFKCAFHAFIEESCLIFEKLYVWKVLKMLLWQFWRSYWDVQLDSSAGVNKTCDLRRTCHRLFKSSRSSWRHSKSQGAIKTSIFIHSVSLNCPLPNVFWVLFLDQVYFGSSLCNAGRL